LKVIKRDKKRKGTQAYWICRCKCGGVISTKGHNLRSGATKSCGCFAREQTTQRNTIHGLSNDRLHRIWSNMQNRCYDQNNDNFSYYGGRGITVCSRWLKSFLSFYLWSWSHGYQPWLTLDRRDNNDRYCPENCRWVTWEIQAHNRGGRFIGKKWEKEHANGIQTKKKRH
jgi:hypothetical protein